MVYKPDKILIESEESLVSPANSLCNRVARSL
jgi:hypothetical protein